jgi:N-acyl-D-amino-acid deacylase
MRHGRLIYARGFGLADIEADEPVRPDSLFRIASVSKPITAVAVLQLVEQGKLGLDDKAFERLHGDPAFNPHGTPDPRLRQVTIRQLLRHTGGWDRDVSFDPMFRPIEIARELDVDAPAGTSAVIRYMGGKPLDFNPGERYAYSNYGYCVLGRLIEKASGQPYEAYVKEHVLLPLGITRMKLGHTLLEDRAEGEVKYYEPEGKPEPAVVGKNIGQDAPLPYGAWYLEAMDAHGGWIASAVDLVRFAAAFDDPARCPLLKAGTIAEMFARPEGWPVTTPRENRRTIITLSAGRSVPKSIHFRPRNGTPGRSPEHQRSSRAVMTASIGPFCSTRGIIHLPKKLRRESSIR